MSPCHESSSISHWCLRTPLLAEDVPNTSNNMIYAPMQHFLHCHIGDLGHVKAPAIQGC